MVRRNKIILLSTLIIFSAYTVSAVSISEGTKFRLNDHNTSIISGENYNFDNLTVYGDKVSFEAHNLSLESNYTGETISYLEEFNPDASIGDKVLKMIVVSDSNQSLSSKVSLRGLNVPSGVYQHPSGQSSSSKIDFKVKTKGNSTIVIKHIKTSSEDDSNDGSSDSIQSSRSGINYNRESGPIDSDVIISDDKTSDELNETPNEEITTASIEFEKDALKLDIKSKSNKTVKLKIVNRINETSSGEFYSGNLSVNNLPDSLKIAENSQKILNITFFGKEHATSGEVEYNYSGGKAVLPVAIDTEKQKIEIESDFTRENKSLNFSVFVNGSEKGDRVETIVYNSLGERIYNRTYIVSSDKKRVEGKIKEIGVGNYTLKTTLYHNNQSRTYSKDFSKGGLKNNDRDFNILSIILFATLIAGIFFLVAISRRHENKKRFQKNINSALDKVKVQNRHSLQFKQFNEKFLQYNSSKDSEIINQSYVLSQNILESIKDLEDIPADLLPKIVEADRKLSKEEFEQVYKNLKIIEEAIIDENISETEEILDTE